MSHRLDLDPKPTFPPPPSRFLRLFPLSLSLASQICPQRPPYRPPSSWLGPQVTDLLLGVLAKAEKRDKSYAEELAALEAKHVDTATELLGAGELLEAFLQVLREDIVGLQALLKAISVAGTSTGAFSDFVVGHGELWSAQLMSAVIKKNGGKSTWMDARQVRRVRRRELNHRHSMREHWERWIRVGEKRRGSGSKG